MTFTAASMLVSDVTAIRSLAMTSPVVSRLKSFFPHAREGEYCRLVLVLSGPFFFRSSTFPMLPAFHSTHPAGMMAFCPHHLFHHLVPQRLFFLTLFGSQ